MNSPEIGLRSDPLYVKVYTLLKGWILDGKLSPGERIRETGLAAEIHVSRTPVRDALRRLEQDRLIVPVPGPAYEVYNPTMADLEDFYQVRTLLESGAARLAAERRDNAIIDDLAAILEQMRTAYGQEPVAPVMELDTQFHERLVAASQSPVLVELHNHLSTRLRHLRGFSGDFRSRQQVVLAQHAAIVDALRSGSGDVAEQATRTHIQSIYAYVRTEFGKRSLNQA